ncbi:MAG: DsrE family protein [Candidatus Thermoplasmatota archaeon]|nr:DsrE family protein [Candidatus Thermoplasmatota archaeon]
MAKILVVLITGKENINTEMVAFNFAVNTARNAGATVEMLFLGRGIQALNSRQRNSAEFGRQIEEAKSAGVTLKGCSVSAKAEGLGESDIFPGVELVMGGVEVNRRIDEGYSVLTF